MGHRANYVLKENGRVQIRYDQWGAQGLASLALAGPDEIRAWIVSQGEPRAELLPGGDCEGILFMDADQRLFLIDEHHQVPGPPVVRRTYMSYLRHNWPGWQVRWAHGGMKEIADAAGCKWENPFAGFFQLRYGERVLEDYQVQVTDLEHDPACCPRESSSLVTVQGEDGGVADYFLKHPVASVLSVGAPLFELLSHRKLGYLPTEREGLDQNLHFGVVLDAAGRHIWVHEINVVSTGTLAEIRERWPGWTIHANPEGLLMHAWLTGRDPEQIKLPDDEAIAALREQLGSLPIGQRVSLASAKQICESAARTW